MRRPVLFIVSFIGSIVCSNMVFMLPEHSTWYGAGVAGFANIADQMVGMFVAVSFMALGWGMILVPKLAPIENEKPGERQQMGWGMTLGGIIGIILVVS